MRDWPGQCRPLPTERRFAAALNLLAEEFEDAERVRRHFVAGHDDPTLSDWSRKRFARLIPRAAARAAEFLDAYALLWSAAECDSSR